MSQKRNVCESPRASEHSQGFAQATIEAANTSALTRQIARILCTPETPVRPSH